jgi:2-oxoglutarate/2-oxoacid ferredoxin oxidoreductase subunit alpha
MITIKIAAYAGEGAFSIGNIISKLFAKIGYYVIGYPEYPSLIKGGLNVFYVTISENRINSPHIIGDVLISIGKDGYKFLKDGMKKDALILGDENIPEGYKIPINSFNLNPKVKNILLTAVALASFNFPKEIFIEAVKNQFKSKSEDIINQNILAIEKGYQYAKENGIFYKELKPINRNIFVATGNEIFGMGAIRGGMKFAAFYPMTPASSLFHYLISVRDKAKIWVVQAEDEIAAANMAIGANYAGVRALTGTSGGGFALMTETVSMVGISETPMVYFVSQRVGPSTGMPTWTEQADLFQIWGAGQGEFPKIILAPGTPEEIYSLMQKSFNLAQKYQLPVFVLSDKFLSETIFPIEKFEEEPIETGKLILQDMEELEPGKRFLRYGFEQDGISYMPIPGVKGGYHVASSYEHMEDSFSTENFEIRKKQVEKRMKKIESILKNENTIPKIYSRNSNKAIICWGSQVLPLLDSNIDMDIIHFSWIYPLDSEKIKNILNKYEKIGVLENNSTFVFYRFLRMFVDFKADFFISKYTGRPFFSYQIERAIKENLSSISEDIDTYELYTPWRY